MEYREFIVSKVFGKTKLGKYHNPNTLEYDENGYPYICASNLNNGINKQLPRVIGDNLTLTPSKIVAWGKQCPMFTYHDEPCVTSQGMYYLDISEYNEEIALYLCATLQKACGGNYGYSNCLIGSIMDSLRISLPVLIDTETNQPKTDETRKYHTEGYIPDWEYMQERIKELEQERIKELEQERIKELEQYLIVTGLNDYELSEEDKEVLATKLFDGGQSGSPTSGDGYWKEAREFQLSELFGQPTRGTRLTKGKRVSGDVPLVTAGFNNEGVAEYIGNLEQQTFHGGLTIDMFGNCFYRDYDFKADDNILVFDKTDISEETKLYVATNIRKSLNGLFDYGRQYRQKTYNETTVSLPIQTTSEKEPVIDEEKRYHPEGYVPDWEYMEKYIRALEKVVVKDVVEWKDEMIEKTKMVVEE